MSPEYGNFYGLERIGSEQLQQTMLEQAEAIAFTLSPYQSLEGSQQFVEQFRDSLQLRIVDKEHLYGRVPAQIQGKEANKERIVHFDVPTYEDLCDELVEDYQISATDVATLYIGSGLALRVLEERIGMNPTQIERLWNIMKDPLGIDQAIMTSGWFNDSERRLLLNATMNIDYEDRIARINALRFGMGVLFYQTEEQLSPDSAEVASDSYQTRISEHFKAGLRAQLNAKGTYAQVLRSFGRDEFTIDRAFSEGLPELGIAGSFPMQVSELRTVLSIAPPQ